MAGVRSRRAWQRFTPLARQLRQRSSGACLRCGTAYLAVHHLEGALGECPSLVKGDHGHLRAHRARGAGSSARAWAATSRQRRCMLARRAAGQQPWWQPPTEHRRGDLWGGPGANPHGAPSAWPVACAQDAHGQPRLSPAGAAPHPAQALQGGPALDEHALLCSAGQRAHHRGRGAQNQRARAGGDEQLEGEVDPVLREGGRAARSGQSRGWPAERPAERLELLRACTSSQAVRACCFAQASSGVAEFGATSLRRRASGTLVRTPM